MLINSLYLKTLLLLMNLVLTKLFKSFKMKVKLVAQTDIRFLLENGLDNPGDLGPRGLQFGWFIANRFLPII